MRFEEVYIVDHSHLNSKTPKRYFKNLVPDFAIHMCENCCKFFVLDEYEFAYMEHGYCPFCKHVEKEKGEKQVFGSLADMANNWDFSRFFHSFKDQRLNISPSEEERPLFQ